jgi:origin recognition complex subunit 2
MSGAKSQAAAITSEAGGKAAALRNEASQSVLAALAALPQLHLIGSTSHRHAALLWEAQLVRQLNPLWTEMSTAQPCAAECLDTVHTALDNLHDASASSESQSVETVLQGLAPKAGDALRFLAQHQLQHAESKGLSFTHYYNGCRDKDYVSDEATLRGFLREFTSHALVRTRRGRGGQECYYCTLSQAKMQEVVGAKAA